MNKQNENVMKETQTAFALTMLLMNFLLLIVIGQTVWLVHSILNDGSLLNFLSFGNFIR